jgi:hypothetical protein
MNKPKPVEKYIPIPEELVGESWEYCFGSGSGVLLPPKDDEHPDTQ